MNTIIKAVLLQLLLLISAHSLSPTGTQLKQWRSCFAKIALVSTISLTTQVDLAQAGVSKTEFLKETSVGVSIDVRKNIEQTSKDKAVESGAQAKQLSGIRVVDLGGSRGARGLAGDGGLSKGNLYDQLQQYGGEKVAEREDTSLKNPLVYKSGIADQLKVFNQLNSK